MEVFLGLLIAGIGAGFGVWLHYKRVTADELLRKDNRHVAHINERVDDHKAPSNGETMLNKLGITATLVRIRLDRFEELRTFMERAIDQEKKHVKDWYNKERRDSRTAEEREDLADYASDQWHRVEVEFGNALRSALCVAIYSMLEAHMKGVCKLAPVLVTPSRRLKPEDLAGRGIQRYLTYIDKVMGMSVDASSGSWSHIDALRKIRNATVQQRGNH